MKVPPRIKVKPHISFAVRICLFLTVCVVLSNNLYGQIIDLRPFYSSKIEPEELNISSADRINKIYTHFSTKHSKEKEEDYEEFVYRSNYFLETLNASGQVFYGDPISSYLNELKDLLLDNHPMKNEVRVYLTRHPSLNAFTNDFGHIYVNVGAVSKMDNELELLALLAHEIAHILNEHSHQFEEFRKTVEGGQWKESNEQEVLKKHAFNRKQELQADGDGFELLKTLGVDRLVAVKIFNKLKFDLNPSIQGLCTSNDLFCNHPQVANYYSFVKNNIEGVYKSLEPRELDSLTTHPSAQARLQQIAELIKVENNTNTYVETGKFQKMRETAHHVLVNVYIENGWFVECLDLLTKLSTQSSDDPFLIKSKGKVLLLLTQEKYSANPFNQFLNDKGSSFSDTSFLELKEAIKSLNALEMNLMSLLAVDQLRKDYSIKYLDRIHNFLVQFLYKYNATIFTNEHGKISLLPYNKLDSNNLRVNDLSLNLNLTKDEKKLYKKLVKKSGFVAVPFRHIDSENKLVNYFFTNYELTHDDRLAIQEFKERRDLYEQQLTIDKVFVSIDPYESLRRYRRGVYNQTNKTLDLDSVVLVQSYNYFLKGRSHQYKIDLKKSLELEKQMIQTLNTSQKITENYSNLALEKISVEDINIHYSLLLWTYERFAFNDLIFSVVDEQIEDFKRKKKGQYLLFNINGTSVNKRLRPRNISYGYNVIFDLHSEGVCYISKIASKEKGNPLVFQQIFHLSDYNVN